MEKILSMMRVDLKRWQFCKDIVMEIIIKDLGDLGINFQNFVSEKSLYSSWENTKKF